MVDASAIQISDMPSLFRVLTEVLSKGPAPSQDDERYKKQLDALKKVTEDDISGIISKHEDAVHRKATKAIYDPSEEVLTVEPPEVFGTEEIDEATNREIREWIKDNRNMGSGWPTVHMVFQKMVAVHNKCQRRISEEAWRNRLISMFTEAKQRETMEWFRQKDVPARKYFPQMLKSFKSHMTKSEAQLELNKVVTNMKAEPIGVLEKIEQYVRLTEVDPEQHLQTCRNEATRYLTLYSGPAMSETILLSYNMKGDDSFRSYIQVAKQFESKIREEHEKLMEANTKRVRQVEDGSESRSDQTAWVRQTQAGQEKTCFTCSKPGHFSRECPQKGKEDQRKCHKCGGAGHLIKDCRKCSLHPTASHSDEECRDQKNDPCTHPAHVGKAKHGNKACYLQIMCRIHGNHLQKDCRQQGNSQGRQQGQQPFRNRQYGQQQYQQNRNYHQGYQGFQNAPQYRNTQQWGNGQQNGGFQQNQQQQQQNQQNQQNQKVFGQQQGQTGSQKAHTNQVQLEQLNQIQKQVGQLVEITNQAMQLQG